MFPGLTNFKTNNQPQVNRQGLGRDNTLINGIPTQNLGGNSLTQQLRGTQNLMGTQGSGLLTSGQDITNTALPGFGVAGDTTGTALGTTGTALDTTRGALNTLSPAESYWSKLLSGDQATMNQAIAPTATQVGRNYANAASNVAMGAPRGGYAGALSAGLPQAQAREINEELYKLQPTAATNLNAIAGTRNAIGGTQNAIAGTQSNIAGVQGQIANWLASIGVDVSKLGAGMLDSLSQSLLGGRGQDVAEHGQSMQLAGQTAQDATSLGLKRMGG